MWATKAYILKIDSDISNEYAKICADSCDDVGLRWEYFNGYQNQSGKSVFASLGIHCVHPEPYAFIANPTPAQKAACTTAGHFAIWKAISEGPDEAVVILEHDAIMLHPVTVDVPDDRIVVLGYKVLDPTSYDHKTAGMPRELIELQGHEGAHAYAITRVMAKKLLKELQEQGIRSAIDNDYFIVNQRRTKYQLCIASPTPALGWLRESTIWGKSAARNYKFIPSFQENYK